MALVTLPHRVDAEAAGRCSAAACAPWGVPSDHRTRRDSGAEVAGWRSTLLVAMPFVTTSVAPVTTSKALVPSS